MLNLLDVGLHSSRHDHGVFDGLIGLVIASDTLRVVVKGETDEDD